MAENNEQITFEFEPKKTIKGYPELHWTGKRPFKSTVYYPAQLKESYGDSVSFTDNDGNTSNWFNKIFWGDNLQVMSHLLKEFRGQVDLIYIDPPFDSKADYKKKIQLKGQTVTNDSSTFEEKQYGDIWTNDEYLQFMYERLILIKELLSVRGAVFLHCDSHKSHYLRIILDEVFGCDNFINEIVWRKSNSHNDGNKFGCITETIFFYSKTSSYLFNRQFYDMDVKSYNLIEEETGRKYKSVSMNAAGSGEPRYFGDKLLYPPLGTHWRWSQERINAALNQNPPKIFFTANGVPRYKQYMDEMQGNPVQNLWTDEMEELPIENLWMDFMAIPSQSSERVDYTTQKPEALLERIILTASNPGDLVFDCFMGSGTTQAVAMKLGRRFIGADINLGAVQTTTKRLLKIAKESQDNLLQEETIYKGFEVYNVNNYEIFRNPIEARSILLQALEVEPFESSSVYDGEKDGRMVKIIPTDVNRIATKADLKGFIANLPYKVFERRKEENPNESVLKLTVVCMGHEPDLGAELKKSLSNYKVDIEIVDILTDRKDLQFKRDAQGEVVIEDGKLVIKNFYPLNLMQKLSMQRDNVDEWRQLVESVMVDFNYDGAVLSPSIIDVPDKNDLVKGIYSIPENAGKIKVKITDLLSESLELELEVK